MCVKMLPPVELTPGRKNRATYTSPIPKMHFQSLNTSERIQPVLFYLFFIERADFCLFHFFILDILIFYLGTFDEITQKNSKFS
jgi:hypothetical protein